MRRFGVAALAAGLLLLCQACEPGGSQPPAVSSPPESPPPVFAAEVGYELHMDEPGYCKVDVVFPRVADSVVGGAEINARLAEDFIFTEDSPWVAEGYPYTWSQVWYSVSEQGGIYSLDILMRTSSLERPEYGSMEHVISYYYDANTREIIPTREAYLAELGYDDGDILAMLKERYGDKYDGLAFQLRSPDLWYYFDAGGEIVFFTQMLDYMVAQRDALLEHEFIQSGALNRAAIAAAGAANPQGTARRLANLYADIIRYGADIDVVDWGDGYWAEEEANKLASFERLFDRGDLMVTELHPKENYVDTYECTLVSSGPLGQRRVPLLISLSPDAAQCFYCPLPTYAEKCFSVTKEYLRLLHEGDAGVLSAWLSIDGGPEYFREEAEALIAYYQRYDLSETRGGVFDFDFDRDCFVMSVYDATGARFLIPLSYDGIFVLPNFRATLNGEWNTLSHAEDAVITLGESKYFTRAELEAAVASMIKAFLMLDDCTLQWITYDEVYADEQYVRYMEHGHGLVTGAARENIVIFTAYFEPGEYSHISVYESGGGWSWTLIRDGKGEPWRVDVRGY